MYSSVCGEFASHGFVVCAVEHRDGSGPRTFINRPKYAAKVESEDCEPVDYTAEEVKQGYRSVDYVFSKYNPSDTSPHSEKGVDQELRAAQIDLRTAEIEEAYHVMCEIEKGNGQLIADRNLRCEGYKASSRHGLKGVRWPRWKGSFQTQNVTICGHSFGAATAVEILRHDDRFNYVTQGIIYDIWGAGLKQPKDESPEHRIQKPIIAINSEAFTYWPSNFELVRALIEEAQSEPGPAPAWLMTLRGTVHITQSDFSLLFPQLCSLLLKAVANPRRALDLNIGASLEFLNHVLPEELAQVNRSYKNENLLESNLNPLSRIQSFQMAKPDEKYTALKLNIRHEWAYRISPKLFQRYIRWENERRGRKPEDFDEIWLHHKPDPNLLHGYAGRSSSSRTSSSSSSEEEASGTNSQKKSTTDEENYEPAPLHPPPHTDSKDWTMSSEGAT
jgi:platelet-activating factor acetylhydrolase